MLRRLGSGAMGVTLLAVHEDLDRLVAVKRLRPELVGEPMVQRRFAHETQVASHVFHENVAPLVAAGAIDDVPFLATEYVFGVSLARLIDRIRHRQIDPPPVGVALAVGRDLLCGLEAIHSARHRQTGVPLNLLHHDVSPRTVLLGFSGRTRLIDLGLGRSVLVDPTNGTTDDEVLAGAFDYMAPEQRSTEPVDARIDVYSAAVTLWELLVGERVSQASAALPEPLRIHRPDASRCLETALMKAMAPDRTQRTESALALRRALDEDFRWLRSSGRRAARAWLDGSCATLIAQERRQLAEARRSARGRASSSEERVELWLDNVPPRAPGTARGDPFAHYRRRAPATPGPRRPSRARRVTLGVVGVAFFLGVALGNGFGSASRIGASRPPLERTVFPSEAVVGPEFEARRAELAMRLESIRRVRTDVSSIEKLTFVSARLAKAQTVRELTRIRLILEALERERPISSSL